MLEDLAKRLEKNYDEIVENDVVRDVLYLVRRYPRPEYAPFVDELSVKFIKQLTKVARTGTQEREQGIEMTPDAEVLKALVAYTRYGLDKIEAGMCLDLSACQGGRMHGHLYACGAAFKEMLAQTRKQDRRTLLEEAYRWREESTRICAKVDTEYSIGQVIECSRTAEMIAETCVDHAEKEDWVKKSREHLWEAATWLEESALEGAGYKFALIGEELYRDAMNTKDDMMKESLLRDAMMCAERATERLPASAVPRRISVLMKLGRYGRILHGLTHDLEGYRIALRSYRTALKLAEGCGAQYKNIVTVTKTWIKRTRQMYQAAFATTSRMGANTGRRPDPEYPLLSGRRLEDFLDE